MTGSNLRRAAAGGGAAGYEVDYSCRFNDHEVKRSWLVRTGGDAGNTKTNTFFIYCKRSRLGALQKLISADNGAVSAGESYVFEFNADDKLRIYIQVVGSGGAATIDWLSTRVFRDCHAWYFFTFTMDSTPVTPIFKVWNWNDEITEWTKSEPNPLATDNEFRPGTAGTRYLIASWETGASQWLGGYVAQAGYMDGTVVTNPVAGGLIELDDNGVYRPLDVSDLDYGDAGHFLDFAVAPDTDNGAGTDVSGNANHFTDGGSNLTAADRTSDSPTNNYCVLSPLNEYTTDPYNITGASGNVDWVSTIDGAQSNGTIAFDSEDSTGFYFEYTPVNAPSATISDWSIGILSTQGVAEGVADDGTYVGLYNFDCGDGDIQGGGVLTANAAWDSETNGGMSLGETLQVVVKAGKVYFGVDNVWYDSSDDTFANAGEAFTGLTGYFVPSGRFGGTSDGVHRLNCGSAAYVRTKPAGLKDINTTNLAVPALKDGANEFVIVTDTESNIAATLATARTGWTSYLDILKNRDSVESWIWRFSHDGSNELLLTGTGNLTYQSTSSLTGSDAWIGMSIKVDGTVGKCRAGSQAHVNGAGDTTVSFTSVGTTDYAVFIHDRGADEKFILHHPDTTAGYNILLDSAYTQGNGAGYMSVQNKTATSFDIDSLEATGTYDYIVLPQSELISLNGYVPNTNADGPLILSQHSPKAAIVRANDGVSNTYLIDLVTQVYNQHETTLKMNDNRVEGGTTDFDLLSNGFKLRANDDANEETHCIAITFMDAPFGGFGGTFGAGSGASPATAR